MKKGSGGWRKLGDKEEQFYQLLDYVLEGLRDLKTAIRKGEGLQGQEETKIDVKEIWCKGLNRPLAGDDTSLYVKEAKSALRRMKAAKILLNTVLDTLGATIRTVTNDVLQDCRATGLASLPDEILGCIFETYSEMCILSQSDGHLSSSKHSQILASVSKRFRRVALRHSNLWKHVSLQFSKERLLLHKDRCPKPIIYFDTINMLSPAETDHRDKFDMIQPYQDWRELHLTYANEDHGHVYYDHLRSLITGPLESLKYLKISDELKLEDEDSSIYLDADDPDLLTLRSWQMPNLSHLELNNTILMAPLQSENVTQFSMTINSLEEENLDMDAIQTLLQSMPRIESLLFNVNGGVDFSHTPETPLELPNLATLALQIDGKTSFTAYEQLLALVNTQDLTRLTVEFLPGCEHSQDLFPTWIYTVFPFVHPDLRPPYPRVKEFKLELHHFQSASGYICGIFRAMPSAENITLILHHEDPKLIYCWEEMMAASSQGLRSLRIELPNACPHDFAPEVGRLADFFGDGYWDQLEIFELQFRSSDDAEHEKTRLHRVLGEKLRWME
ncbi:hypothetical protein SCHPADRAFT_908963 [Schizopora paradoxa]|uniref:F-box domain-containing protein n=1 Tax=Schizopora paradoxa TaxID=27342 RepID=A0A0H2R868_9AGAM|nr:hypothetical protein SCHPADRAFT_908963 [Schizopora paradoxa]